MQSCLHGCSDEEGAVEGVPVQQETAEHGAAAPAQLHDVVRAVPPAPRLLREQHMRVCWLPSCHTAAPCYAYCIIDHS